MASDSRKQTESAEPAHYHTGRFPPKDLDWSRLAPLIGPAHSAVARFDSFLSTVPNAEVLLSPMTTREAVLSSKIEGTVTTLGEVLAYEAGANRDTLDPAKAADCQEVLNYRDALREAVSLLDDLPLCGRLIRQVHARLLADVRGDDMARGHYRTIQNYIGRPGQSVEQARFVPIAPELLEAGMTRWEKHVHADAPDAPDRLVQLAISHAEFESLHPFLDGNGRLGRILIPLFLYAHKLLQAPVFYLSEYLESHREEYVDRLLAVSRDDNWIGWIEFFLRAVTRQAELNQNRALDILDLYEEKERWIVDVTQSKYAIRALDFVFRCPMFLSTDFTQNADIPESTARKILKVLSHEGLLKPVQKAKGRLPATVIFPALLNIGEGREVF